MESAAAKFGPEGEGPHFSMGLDTLRVPMSMHSENRARFLERMVRQGHDRGIVLLMGGKQECRYDTDHENIFRQESYFQFLFGVKEGDFFGAIELSSGRTVLFCPRLPASYAIWMGRIKSPAEFQKAYAVDEVLYVDELDAWVERTLVDSSLYLLRGLNTDSGVSTVTTAEFPSLAKHAPKVDYDTLHPILAETRVFKSEKELRVMRYVSWVTSMAHVEVMRRTKAGMPEYQLESLFRHHTYTYGGCRHEAYTCICACGPNSSTLHYGHAGAPNDRVLTNDDIALLDMGAEYHCYCSDITCSFPVSGKFSKDQRIIFEGALAAQKAVMDCLRPGTDWTDMHRLAWRTILSHLLLAGILQGDLWQMDLNTLLTMLSQDEMMAVGLGAVFIPCGLGHFIGLDTHDVGGYLPHCPPRLTEPGINKLRTARILEEGMVLTVEPGIYFIDATLEPALADPNQAKFIVKERLEAFRSFGGVRLEDVVVITADSFENYTLTPSTVEEIEAVMAGGVWPPVTDEAPWLKRKWL